MATKTKVQWRRRAKDESGICNEDRAEWGQSAVEAYTAIKWGDDDRGDIVDCMADLMHYAASLGIEPEEIVRSATNHFEAER